MGKIHVLDKLTIDQIAAGEVVERPSSVVKELVENAMDAGAKAVSVEIRNGGIDLIRVTDNGSGIARDDVPTAFLRHATSKIRDASDLERIASLGFRGEALSSIAAVSRLELITKRKEDVAAVDYEIEGGDETAVNEIGAPDGTTFIVKDLFWNTPARRKFLKTPMTEASYVADLLEHMALSRPDVSVRFINNGNVRLTTPGNGRVRDLIYAIYGRETANLLLPVDAEKEGIRITGFIGKPELAKGNRGFESFFINGRYVRSQLISKAIEEAYSSYMMQHRYPFTVLYLTIPAEEFDINVHPSKMELRFRKEPLIYETVRMIISDVLHGKELIPEAVLTAKKEAEQAKDEKPVYNAPEPFEEKRIEQEKKHETVLRRGIRTAVPAVRPDAPEKRPEPEKKTQRPAQPVQDPVSEEKKPEEAPEKIPFGVLPHPVSEVREKSIYEAENEKKTPVQTDLFSDRFLSEEGLKRTRIIGQIFRTYWLIEAGDKMYIMDQHAAHEKVLYEQKLKELHERKMSSQMISPPAVVTLTAAEDLILNRYMEAFSSFGYEISSFGGTEYAISAVPADLYGVDVRDFFQEVLSDMASGFGERNHETILRKIATASCKAAVKGNQEMTEQEADALLKKLLTLENPYMCPHGRPTLITMTRTELEKKFKRIV